MNTSPLSPWLACLLLVVACGAASAVEVTVDLRAAPECQAFADVATKLIVEWTPKVHEILDGGDAPLADRTVKVTFRPMDGVAHAKGGEIVISSEWVTKKAPEDYGMVIHELVHVLQDYRRGSEFWVTEGIADYVRYEQYEPGKQKWRLQPGQSSYRQGYGIAGAFLGWLAREKDPEIVRKLNAACRAGQYQPELFEQWCGASVDALWDDYVKSQQQP
jgi:hypothetical protein